MLLHRELLICPQGWVRFKDSRDMSLAIFWKGNITLYLESVNTNHMAAFDISNVIHCLLNEICAAHFLKVFELYLFSFKHLKTFSIESTTE